VGDSTRLGASTDAGTPVGAPIRWLVGAALCVVAAFFLGAGSGEHPALWLAGWVAGGFGTVGLIAWFTVADSRRRTDAWYVVRPAVSRVRTALIVLAAVSVIVNAWRFSDWVSRR